MSLQRKLIVVALAGAMPWVSAQAQSAADLQKEIAALKAQMQALQAKVDAVTRGGAPSDIQTQVNRIELKQDQVEADVEKAGLKGLNFKGTIEARYQTDNLSNIHTMSASDGNGANAMLELTKETDGGEGISWTLRLTPGGLSQIHEASISAPVGDSGSRLIGGLMPDFQGYEGAFANQNPLVTHNALFDFAGATSYTGLGMSHSLFNSGGQILALKWMIGNIDSGNDTKTNAAGDTVRTTGAAFRFDYTMSEYATFGFSGALGASSREFQIFALDGGYIRGDWLFNGHVNVGTMKEAAAVASGITQADASWWGLSALAGYKVTPRLQLLVRGDYINNEKNGGGIYTNNCIGGCAATTWGTGMGATGFGPTVADPNIGSNLTRVSLGTNYVINPSTQWKAEYRIDRSSGDGFVDSNNAAQSSKQTFATSVVVAF